MRADRPRIVHRAVHGVLLLDKPLGLSSNDALQKARRLFRAEKAGHTGTLDPLANGLLPLCFGAATKFSQVSLDADKRYRATLQLGRTTTTADGEGEVLQERAVAVSREQIETACQGFVGPIAQVPPMHSALKHEGRALYEYARAGIEIERVAREVTIHAIAIVDWQHDVLTVDVRCSKGTYIRTLAADIGEALGCGAYLSALRRTASGDLTLDAAHTLESLAALDESARDALLLPADTLLAGWPEVALNNDDAGRFLSGLRRRLDASDAPRVRVYGLASQAPPGGLASQAPPGGPASQPPPGSRVRRAFLGSAHITAQELIPTRLLSPLEVQGLLDTPARHPSEP